MSESQLENQQILVGDIVIRQDKLSDWEINFIGSCCERLENNKLLTDKQAQIVNEIWERVTG
jgi:hypothetical protein